MSDFPLLIEKAFFALIRRVVNSDVAVRRLVMVGFDLAICAVATWIAFWLRLGMLSSDFRPLGILFLLSGAIWLAITWQAGTYRSIVRFSGRSTMIRLAVVATLQAIALTLIFWINPIAGVPRTLAVIQPLVMVTGVVVLRVMIRQLLLDSLNRNVAVRNERRIVIFGAGEAGQRALAVMRPLPNVQVMAIVDDDPKRHGSWMDGIAVFNSSHLTGVVDQFAVTEVLLAIPNASADRRREILFMLTNLSVRVRTLPDMIELLSGAATISDVADVDPAELLGRSAVEPDIELLRATTSSRTVMITGAGGSIGRELAEQVLLGDPVRLVLVEVSESSLYLVEQRLVKMLRARGPAQPPIELVLELGNCTDEAVMDRLFRRYRPDTVFHAAAYKHVPMLEANPVSGVGNNVFGTLNCVQMARRYGTKHFVLVSTDKAVRPTNVMGASKRICELVLQALAAESQDICLAMVRFGNVLNSSGSVVPKFASQIAAGGPVTLTDMRITRYFMTIPEAAQLVIQAGGMARGGDVFLLDMGEPVRIYDLAKTMIQLQGLTVLSPENPGGDIEILEVGLRKGEKLYEELLIDDAAQSTTHRSIFRANENFIPWSKLKPDLDRLAEVVRDGDAPAVLAILLELVPEFVRDPAIGGLNGK